MSWPVLQVSTMDRDRAAAEHRARFTVETELYRDCCSTALINNYQYNRMALLCCCGLIYHIFLSYLKTKLVQFCYFLSEQSPVPLHCSPPGHSWLHCRPWDGGDKYISPWIHMLYASCFFSPAREELHRDTMSSHIVHTAHVRTKVNVRLLE